MSTHRWASFGLALSLVAASGLLCCGDAARPPLMGADGAWIMQQIDGAGGFRLVIDGSRVVQIQGPSGLQDVSGSIGAFGDNVYVSCLQDVSDNVSILFLVEESAVFQGGGSDLAYFDFVGANQGDGTFLGTLKWGADQKTLEYLFARP